MNTMDERMQSLVTERAAEWFIAHRGGTLSSTERAEFVAWLRASPEHIREYLAVAGASRDVATAALDFDVDLETLLEEARQEGGLVIPLADPSRRESGQGPIRWTAAQRPRTLFAGAAVAIIAIACTSLWFVRDGEWLGMPRTYRTGHAEQSTWRLPDGSVLQLNSGSRVTVRFSRRERQIEVERGQAHFHVTHEPIRSFRVSAGDAEVLALGTEFDVYRRRDATVVTVVEGRVAVRRHNIATGVVDTASVAAIPTPPSRVELIAGQTVEINAEAAAPVFAEADLRESTAWLQRQIIFEQRQLGVVVDEFNRYSRIPIEIENAEVSALRISGVFNAYDTESFIAFLRRLDGVAVQTSDSAIRIRSRPARRVEPLTVRQ
jgi:transmembrane sensor